jgi:hypothetical protein
MQGQNGLITSCGGEQALVPAVGQVLVLLPGPTEIRPVSDGLRVLAPTCPQWPHKLARDRSFLDVGRLTEIQCPPDPVLLV